jgi:membrane-anchored glycerophosphoryl diester phosphodiesterase (GDPDase)
MRTAAHRTASIIATSSAVTLIIGAPVIVLVIGTLYMAILETTTDQQYMTFFRFVASIGIVFGAFAISRFSLTPAALTLEDVSMVRALQRSWILTRRGKFRTLVTLCAGAAIALTVEYLIAIPVELLFAYVASSQGTTLSTSIVFPMFLALVQILGAMVASPFMGSVIVLRYIDARIRTEGVDIALGEDGAL